MGISLSHAVGPETTALSKDSCRAMVIHHAKDWNKQCEQRFNAIAQLQQVVDRSWLEKEVDRRCIKLNEHISMYTKESCQAIFDLDNATYQWNDSMEKTFDKRAVASKLVTRNQLEMICGSATVELLPPEVTSIDRISAIALFQAAIEGTKKPPVTSRNSGTGSSTIFPDIHGRAVNKYSSMPTDGAGAEQWQWTEEMDAKFQQSAHTERVVTDTVFEAMIAEQGPSVPRFVQHFNHRSCLHSLHNRGWTGALQRSWDVASKRMYMVRRKDFVDVVTNWQSFQKGDTVQVRGAGEDAWRVGHVVAIHAGGRHKLGPLARKKGNDKKKGAAQPSVLLVGHRKPFVWNETRPMHHAHVEHLFRLLEHASHDGSFEDLDFYTSKATGTNMKDTKPTRKQIEAAHLVHKSASESVIDCIALKMLARQEPLANHMLHFYQLDHPGSPTVSLEQFQKIVQSTIACEASTKLTSDNMVHEVALYAAQNKTVLQFKETCKHFKRLMHLNHRIEKLFTYELDRHNDLVPVRQLVAILQCAEDHDFIDAQRRSSDSDPGVDAATPKARREGVRRPSKGGKNPRGEKKKKGRRASLISKKQKKKKLKSKQPKNRTDKGPVSKLRQPIDKSSGSSPRASSPKPVAGPAFTSKRAAREKKRQVWEYMKLLGFVQQHENQSLHDIHIEHDRKAITEWVNTFRSDPDQTLTLAEFKHGILSMPIGTLVSVSDSQTTDSKRERRGSMPVNVEGNNDSIEQQDGQGEAPMDLVEARIAMMSKLISKYNQRKYETIRVGDVVQVRDHGEKWKDGVVMRVNYNSPTSRRFFKSHAQAASAKAPITYDVKPEGWDIVATFDCVRSRDAARLASRAKELRHQQPQIAKMWDQALSSRLETKHVPKGARQSAFLFYAHPSTPDPVETNNADIWGAVPECARRATAFAFLTNALRLAEGVASDRHLPYSLQDDNDTSVQKATAALRKTLAQQTRVTENQDGGMEILHHAKRGRSHSTAARINSTKKVDRHAQPESYSPSTEYVDSPGKRGKAVPKWLLHVYQTIKGPCTYQQSKRGKVVYTLPRVHKLGVTEGYNKLCRRLLGNRRMWLDPTKTTSKDLIPLQARALDRLVDIEKWYDKKYYQQFSLGATLGMLGKDRRKRDTMEALQKLRQDAFIPQHPPDVYETLYIAALRRLGLAIDPSFQRKLGMLLKPFGAYVRHAPVKSFARMMRRLNQDAIEGGHMGKPQPRAAFNRDIVRASAVFPSVRALVRCYQELVQLSAKTRTGRNSTPLGKLLHVQNTMRPTLEAHNDYFGVRFIRLYFAFDAGCTWGELLDRDETQKAWSQNGLIFSKLQSDQVWWMTHMRRVDRWQHSLSFRDRPAVFITEVEMMIAPYLEMRLRTHIWRQLSTANNPEDLCNSFLSDSCSTTSCTASKDMRAHTAAKTEICELDAIMAAEFQSS